MARNGFDVRELKKFRDSLVELEENIDSVLEDCAKELAARLIRAVAKRTYPGKPPNFETEFKRKRKKPNPEKEAKEAAQYERYWGSYTGGTLRRGWTSKTHEEAENGNNIKDVKAYVETLPIVRSGKLISVMVINPVEYASYVEYGHRQTPGKYVPAINKKLKKGWVPGQFMMTISAEDIQRKAPQIVEKIIARKLGEYFK